MKKSYFLGLSQEGFHRIAYTEWGNSSSTDTPILCVHGLTRNGRDFDALALFLSEKGCYVFCPDIVGRGDSDWLNDPLHYSYEQYFADMNAMIARMGALQVDWIGTSMGGLIGMVMASLPKSPIRRLVLNDVGPQIPVSGLARLAKYVGKDPDFSNLEEAKNYLKNIYGDFGKLSDEQWTNLTKTSVRELAPGKFVTKLDQNVKISQAKSKLAWQELLHHPLKALEGFLFDIDLWDVWSKVTCPVLVLRGEHSDLLLRSVIEKMKNTHSDIKVLEIKDAGHAPALQNVMEQEIIYEWLTKP